MSDQLAVSFECTQVGSANYNADSDRQPAEVIAEVVADAEGVDPTDLSPLYESIEPDALNRLFGQHGRQLNPEKAFCFTHEGWNVFVRGDGQIIVGDPDNLSKPTSLWKAAADD